MVKLFALGCSALFLNAAFTYSDKPFEKYKPVETYEIRPGVLAMPRYAADGQICEVGLQMRHYSPEIIRLNGDIPEKVLSSIEEELAPLADRGTRLHGLKDLITEQGNTGVQSSEYENISIQTAYETKGENMVVTLHWNKRECF